MDLIYRLGTKQLGYGIHLEHKILVVLRFFDQETSSFR